MRAPGAQLAPLFASTPRALGGLGLAPAELAVPLAVSGVALAVSSLGCGAVGARGLHGRRLAAGALLPAPRPSRQRRARGAVTRGRRGARACRYPAAARHWGTLATCRLGLWLAAPAAGAMAAPSLLPGARRAWAQAALAAVLCAKSVAATLAFTASMIMARGLV